MLYSQVSPHVPAHHCQPVKFGQAQVAGLVAFIYSLTYFSYALTIGIPMKALRLLDLRYISFDPMGLTFNILMCLFSYSLSQQCTKTKTNARCSDGRRYMRAYSGRASMA